MQRVLMVETAVALGTRMALHFLLVCTHMLFAFIQVDENAFAKITLVKLFLKVVGVQMVLQ